MPYDITAYHQNQVLYVWFPPILKLSDWHMIGRDIAHHLHQTERDVFVLLDMGGLRVYPEDVPYSEYHTTWMNAANLAETLVIANDNYPHNLHKLFLQLHAERHFHFDSRWDALHYINKRLPTFQPDHFKKPSGQRRRSLGSSHWLMLS